MGWIHDFIEAAVIMVLGMGVTFCFLAALIFAIQLTARIIAKYAPPPPAPLPASQGGSSVTPSAKDEGAIIAAITIAVKKYRADKKSGIN
jgi:sodium pump decarboxylase gamma subunit